MGDPLQVATVGLVMVGFLEWLCVQLLVPWVFRLGIPVMHRRFPAPDGIHYLAEAVPSQVCLRHVGGDDWIFRHAGGWIDRGAPLRLRSTVHLEGAELVMTGRASFALLALLLCLAATVDSPYAWVVVAILMVVGWFMEASQFDGDCAAVARALRRAA